MLLLRWKTKCSNWHQMYIFCLFLGSKDQEDQCYSSYLEDQRNLVAAISFSTAEQSRFAPFFMVTVVVFFFLHFFLLFSLYINASNGIIRSVCVFECATSSTSKKNTRNHYALHTCHACMYSIYCLLHLQLNDCDFLMKLNYKEDRR